MDEQHSAAEEIKPDFTPPHKPEHHHKPAHKPHHSPKKESGKMPSEMVHKLLLGAAVIQIVLLLFVVSQLGGAAADQPNQPSAAPSAPEPTPVADVDADDDPVLGNADAPVTIIEFSDYQCPFCSRFWSQTLPQIKSQYIATGKVKFVYRDFALSNHPLAAPAAIAANCAEPQGKFWEFHDLIFGNQQSLSEASLRTWATQLGLDMTAWDACRNDPASRAEIQKDFNDGGAAGVGGTPAFFVNGKLLSGAQPFSAFQQAIEGELN
ncbi:TPA: DsbA family protein [Candidatus Woesearchaeota archaeon]|nr:DsbA family protein [Candidatus Woesearchaeota archaeon]